VTTSQTPTLACAAASTEIDPPVGVAGRVAALDQCAAEEIVARLPELAVWPGWDRKRQHQTRLGAASILGWLAGFPGQGWQQRWICAGADADKAWLAVVPVPGRATGSHRAILTHGLAGLLLSRVVLPGYGFLVAYWANTLLRDVRRVIQPEVFEAMTARASASGMAAGRTHVGLIVLAKLLLHTGCDLEQPHVRRHRRVPRVGPAALRRAPGGRPASLGSAARHRSGS
jgi:hypothetical protein